MGSVEFWSCEHGELVFCEGEPGKMDMWYENIEEHGDMDPACDPDIERVSYEDIREEFLDD